MTKHEITHLPANDSTNGWAAFLPHRAPRPRLESDTKADWIVVGAGWAGLAAARRLAENRPGEKVVLIDAAAAGDGASGRNSGFAIDLPHSVGGDRDENDGALGYMRLARGAISYLKEQIDDHGIDCHWREKGKFQAAVTPKGTADYLEPFAEALTRLNEPFEWVEKEVLGDRLGTRHFHAAVFTPGGALLNPVALTRGLADNLPESVDFYEHTPALSVEYANGVRIRTPRGSIDAPRMILASNVFAPQFGQMTGKVLPFVAHASLTRPLTRDERRRFGEREDWGLTPANSFVGTTMRYTDDHRLLVREQILYDPRLKVPEDERRRVAIRHKDVFDRHYPMLKHVPLTHTWSGYVALTRNGAPGFGQAGPGVWTAVCQNAIGVTKGTISGLLAADMACGADNPLMPDMLGLGTPSDLPSEPWLSLGVRARLSWELYRERYEA